MPDRVSMRVPVNIEAEIISYSVSYPAIIRNISEYGIHAKIANNEALIFSKSETVVDLKFRLPSGDTISLFCRKKWAFKNSSNSYIENVGIEIIDPPDEYKNFFRVISHNKPADC
jgi:hypothetical protein